MTLTRGFIRNAATTPLDARLADMAKIVCNVDGSPRTGVLGNNPSIVSTTGTMNVAVAAAEFVASKGKADGVSIFTNDGSVNVAIGAAPGSNSRIDVIWVKHEDNTTGDAASAPIFGVTAGTAAASPVKPSIPTGALELATLRIFAGTVATNGGSNVLTNTYQMTAARGGVIPFRTKTEMDAATTLPDGTRGYTIDKGVDWTSKSGAWRGALQTSTAPTYNGAVWAAHSSGPLQFFVKADGMIGVEGGFQNVGAGAFSAGLAGAKVGDIPAHLRPARTIALPGSQLLPPAAGSGVQAHATLFIQADGQIFVSLSTTGTYTVGGLNVFVAGEYRAA